MANLTLASNNRQEDRSQIGQNLPITVIGLDAQANQYLPISITKAASKQTCYTVRFLVDRERRADAYRAYFRWLDDWLDQQVLEKSERIAFVERQKALMECCNRGEWPSGLTSQERMLVDLIRSDQELSSGLQSYIQHMLAVLAFDADRRGRLISHMELDEYSGHLAAAVTEALHYFIGHADAFPQNEARYLAATAAHITHMLRDTYEDIAAGYFNVPCELLFSAGIQPSDIESDPYRAWVKSRVALARAYFKVGKCYLMGVKNLRCRIAAYAYIARFEYVLNVIEREGYKLRSDYHECQRLSAGLAMGWSVLWSAFRGQFRKSGLFSSLGS